MDIPGGEEFFEQGREMSRRHRGKAGELAYLMASMQEFIRPGVFKDLVSQAESLARRMGDPGWLAAFLMAKAGGLKGTREFPEAFAAIEEAAAIYKKLRDQFHFVECLEERALFRIQTNELKRALADYREAIKIADEFFPIEEGISVRGKAAGALQSQPKLALKFLNE